MAQKFVIAALVCLAGMAAAQTYQTYPAEHRNTIGIRPIEELPSSNAYEFHIVPSSAVAEYENKQPSIWHYVPNPISALSGIASGALTVARWTASNSPVIMLGMALVVGFCACTSYCTLTIERPLARHFRSLGNLGIPYLDDVEYYVKEAYNKYHNMQYHH